MPNKNVVALIFPFGFRPGFGTVLFRRYPDPLKPLSPVLGFFVPSGFRAQKRPWYDLWCNDHRERSRFWPPWRIEFYKLFATFQRETTGRCLPPPPSPGLQLPPAVYAEFAKSNVCRKTRRSSRVVFDTRKRRTFFGLYVEIEFPRKKVSFWFSERSRPPLVPFDWWFSTDTTSLFYSLSNRRARLFVRLKNV